MNFIKKLNEKEDFCRVIMLSKDTKTLQLINTKNLTKQHLFLSRS